jgi:hypothetical protein
MAKAVNVALMRPMVGEAMDQPWIGVEIEDDRPVRGEEGLELEVCQPVRMLGVRDQLEQIHHVHEADLDVGEVLTEQGSGRQRLHRRAVAATRHDDFGFRTLVAARPGPDA